MGRCKFKGTNEKGGLLSFMITGGQALPPRGGKNGFTLLEVIVALLILSTVLASSLQLVHRYADQRLSLRDRVTANQVAWNRLMERYQFAERWLPDTLPTRKSSTGMVTEGARDWIWELESEEAMGKNLFRYKVSVFAPEVTQAKANLTVFLVDQAY